MLPAVSWSSSVLRDSHPVDVSKACAMCTGAILLYGIPRVVVGENQNYMGEEELLRSRGVLVDVLQNPTCIQMMASFIAEYPEHWNEDTGR